MLRSGGSAARPWLLGVLALLAVAVQSKAGPVGPLPNMTSLDIVPKSLGNCAIGDVVYMVGDEFTGSTPCDRCACAGGGKVRCSRQRCEPRPGCKAIHRPDHCCPTYQCECEQEGRVYGNGEKLVDPADPCRVCYCQGGEVVCRRIACFQRDDCKPRLVPGRCCPEYDNCPLRGVTTVPGMAPSVPSISAVDKTHDEATSIVPSEPKENIKQEITIKEITPVSEIPILSGVKIKEILPSPNIEVAEYSSSKAPLIPREVSTEKIDFSIKTEAPAEVEYEAPSSSNTLVPNYGPSESTTKANVNEDFDDVKTTGDSLPSKISLSTQDSINSDIYPLNVSGVTTVAPSVATSETTVATIASFSTKSPVIEEEDPSLFDHNPAFPPLPDDLSVLSNHGDEIVPEQSLDAEHISSGHEIVNIPSITPATEGYKVVSEEAPAVTTAIITEEPITTETRLINDKSNVSEINDSISTEGAKDSPMLNLRSAIPTEILNLPSSVPEVINGDLDEVYEMTTLSEVQRTDRITDVSTRLVEKEDKYVSPVTEVLLIDQRVTSSSATNLPEVIETKPPVILANFEIPSQEETRSSAAKSNIATGITSQPEVSSEAIEAKESETPQVITTDNILKEIIAVTTEISSNSEKNIVTVVEPSKNEVTTEVQNTPVTRKFTDPTPDSTLVLSESTTVNNVELIKDSNDISKSAPIIEPPSIRKNNVLTDLINLVGDVASISEHTDEPESVSVRQVTESFGISDSEELILVNAGYKSKSNNWNLNSITEIPIKNKNTTPAYKLKTIEIESEDEEGITDLPIPNDKVEPTTKRPIIDKVSDTKAENKTVKKDIEIISQTYVPSINKRPTKVIMKKNDKIEADDLQKETTLGASSEITTDDGITEGSPSEYVTTSGYETTSAKAMERVDNTYIVTSTIEPQ